MKKNNNLVESEISNNNMYQNFMTDINKLRDELDDTKRRLMEEATEKLHLKAQIEEKNLEYDRLQQSIIDNNPLINLNRRLIKVDSPQKLKSELKAISKKKESKFIIEVCNSTLLLFLFYTISTIIYTHT